MMRASSALFSPADCACADAAVTAAAMVVTAVIWICTGGFTVAPAVWTGLVSSTASGTAAAWLALFRFTPRFFPFFGLGSSSVSEF